MTYAIGGKIEAADFNGFVSTNATNMNAGWATGAGNSGYGQPAFTPVVVGDPVRARPATVLPGNPPTWSAPPEWRALTDAVNAMNQHQVGSTIITNPNFNTPARAPASAVLPQTGTASAATITWADNLAAAINTVCSPQRLSAVAQRPEAVAVQVTSAVTWTQFLQAGLSVNFGSNDRARYFFNAGGQIVIYASHPAGVGINNQISDICSDLGKIVISSTNGTPPTISIAGVNYTGITKVGGANPGGQLIDLQNNGFYALTGSPVSVFRQTSDTPYYYYGGTYIDIGLSYSSGILSLIALIDLIPNGPTVSAGTQFTVGIRYPVDTTTGGPLVNSWGTATFPAPTITSA